MQLQLIAGRYQVLRAIGRGGMGTVWLCRDEVLGREVAVKQVGGLSGDSASETKRAMREARSAAALNHPNAVAVYDVVDHAGRPWLVMEYVEGDTLADEIARDGRLSPHRVADIGAQLAGALRCAHERLIIHRDIKPGNVLIDKAGRPKISDFGIARGHDDEQLTQIGFITGTPGFLSPELARGGDPHPASDVWALGATLYSALEGQPPYEPKSNPIALLRAIATERPRPMTHTGALERAINAMMHQDPALRWDMATSAKRLAAIARMTAVMPQTMLIALPSPSSTKSLESAQALSAPLVVTAAAADLPAVVKAPVVTPVVAKAPVVTPAVAKAPVVAPTRVVEKPVAQPSVVRPAAFSLVRPAVDAQPLTNPAVGRPEVVVPPGGPGGSRRWLPLVFGALLLASGVFFLTSQLSDQGASTKGTSTQPGATSGPALPKATPGASAKATVPPPAAVSAPSSASPTSDPEADKKLVEFVDNYYSHAPGGHDKTWAQLSTKMQRFAQGRSGYDFWWKQVEEVQLNHTTADASTMTATVNLTFRLKKRAPSQETHYLTFITGSQGYLIDTDTVR